MLSLQHQARQLLAGGVVVIQATQRLSRLAARSTCTTCSTTSTTSTTSTARPARAFLHHRWEAIVVSHAAATHWARETRSSSLTTTNHHCRHHSQTRVLRRWVTGSHQDSLNVFVLAMRVRHEIFVMSWSFHNAYALLGIHRAWHVHTRVHPHAVFSADFSNIVP